MLCVADIRHGRRRIACKKRRTPWLWPSNLLEVPYWLIKHSSFLFQFTLRLTPTPLTLLLIWAQIYTPLYGRTVEKARFDGASETSRTCKERVRRKEQCG
ncbi:hypothetical protein BT93_G0942 [Corymbia citriodora subsp. variegata]|nr:hypothetical protein BT93_G0942 [Corymbia citriodora subsp. variegata]